MEKKDARRKRRAEGDLLPLLRKRRNEFSDYAYAGDPKLMIELFPEMGLTEDSDYFKKIPPSTFDAKNIIEQYGKRLRELRTERGCSLQRVADYIGVDFQAISQVEKGVRKKISRNRLLLLCAFFRCSPEVVLGLEPNTTRVELFFDRQSRDRAFYVVDHLVSLDYACSFSPDELGYYIMDLNGDGINELVVFAQYIDTPLQVWTFNASNNAPCILFEETSHSHILLGDGVIVTFTSTNRTENDDDAFDVWQIEYASTQCSIVGDDLSNYNPIEVPNDIVYLF